MRFLTLLIGLWLLFGAPALGQVFRVVSPSGATSTAVSLHSQIVLVARHATTHVGEQLAVGPYKARVIYRPPGQDDADVAFARVQTDEELFAYSISTRAAKPGDRVLNLGFPLGSMQLIQRRGTVFQIATTSYGQTVDIDMLTQPGQSGSPVFDKYGNIAAMVSSVETERIGDKIVFKRVGICVPARIIQKHYQLMLKQQSKPLIELKLAK